MGLWQEEDAMPRFCIHGRLLVATAIYFTLLAIVVSPAFARRLCRIKRLHQKQCRAEFIPLECRAEFIPFNPIQNGIYSVLQDAEKTSNSKQTSNKWFKIVDSLTNWRFSLILKWIILGSPEDQELPKHTADPQHSMLIRVVDPDGKPIAGATVTPIQVILSGDTSDVMDRVLDENHWLWNKTSTGADGTAPVARPENKDYGLQVAVEADGYVPSSIDWSKEPGSPLPFQHTMKLERARTICGVVRDESGKPVAGAHVILSGTSLARMIDFNRHDWKYSTVPDSSRRFAFDRVLPGRGKVVLCRGCTLLGSRRPEIGFHFQGCDKTFEAVAGQTVRVELGNENCVDQREQRHETAARRRSAPKCPSAVHPGIFHAG
jgi:hypothetical protein